jgi:hypothetical protein
MNGRERLTAIMNRRAADRLSWSALVCGHTLNALPESLRPMSAVEFYRHIGCDILQLEGWGMPRGFASPRLKWASDVTFHSRDENGQRIGELRTAHGVLTSAAPLSHPAHPTKRLVSTIEDVRVYRAMWENATYETADDRPALEAADACIGDDGIVVRFWGHTPIPLLLQIVMGIENFYYIYMDHPDEMDGLIRTMHERELQAFELLAQGPCDVAILVENTSTTFISREMYTRYNGPHDRDFCDIMHAHGKTAIIHMCGYVKNLLHEIKATGLDGIHALTPPPTGDTPWELALDVLGEDLIIISALDPTIFAAGPVDEIGPALDALYTPRLRRAHFVLGVMADGIAIPLERFQAVGKWMERNGKQAVSC